MSEIPEGAILHEIKYAKKDTPKIIHLERPEQISLCTNNRVSLCYTLFELVLFVTQTHSSQSFNQDLILRRVMTVSVCEYCIRHTFIGALVTLAYFSGEPQQAACSLSMVSGPE